MAILWEKSLVPWLDASGDPYSGAKAYFYDSGTLTPIVTYTDHALSIPNDFPVVANSGGAFGPIFLPEQITYHLRIEDADGSTVWDVDGISAPTTVVPDPPSGGTATEFLFQTGDIKTAWRASVPSGFVRLNGRTIGQASSGATERANADCQALFLFLWTEDSALAVSGGRGATAAGDWAAAKTIALPDWRGRTPIGMDSMGNAASGRVTDAQLGSDSDTLGSAGGEAAHTLTTAELASHSHTFTGDALPAHAHTYPRDAGSGSGPSWQGGFRNEALVNTSSVSAGTPTGTISNTGSGTAHNNLQPSVVVPFFIKL
ncbi:hypothetical protein [Mesorhizobium sp. B2-3-2]|uniref:phage tail protein n=1 Tax=Mesorhizobium sp. B2-3-2 TaxID=2589961 RepID=UPI00112DF9A1|nr:hypothetical protein [Mesorhizobium sp. B2-3-2]TPM37055.1 hypothetical protein FJ964_30440 [Mesorhizobium sp. B2-3-2]